MKVELGKKAYELVRNGEDIRSVMEPIAVTCAIDESMTGDHTEPLEIFILGMNEYTIDFACDTILSGMFEAQKQDNGILEKYKESVSTLSKDLKAVGKEELIGTFLPANTMLGMALCKAGEKLMRGEK